MKTMEPREFSLSTTSRSTTAFKADGGFYHGKSPRSIKLTINYIWERLWSFNSAVRTSFVVFMQEAREYYENAARSVGENHAIVKDDRTLKLYLCPSLAVTNIVARQGSRRLGTFFCSLHTFDEVAQMSEEPRKEDVSFSPDELDVMYDEAKEVFRRNSGLTRSFAWNLPHYIRQIPLRLWFLLVNLTKPAYLKRRAKYQARILNESFDLQWPFNSEDVPSDPNALSENELHLATGVLKQIENTIFLRTNGKVVGPLTSAMSVVASGSSKKIFVDFISKADIISSYQAIYGWKQREIEERITSGPFSTLASGAFVIIGIDNINMLSRNQLAVYGQTYGGFDGIAVQALNPNEEFDFQGYCSTRPLIERMPRAMDISNPRDNRNRFIEENFPRHDDCNILAFRYLACGLVLTHKDELTSQNSSSQRSFRSIMMDALTGFPVGKCRVEYVSISRGKLDEVAIVEKLEEIEAFYNPPELRKKPNDYTFVAVHGDQPVFKLLFRQWYRSYTKWILGGAKTDVNPAEDNLFRWLIPLPGGFHIYMQGMIPLIKEYLSGSGLEDLLQFAGFSPGLRKVYMKFNQYRPNRRFLVQILVAMVLRLGDSLCSMSSDFEKQLEECRGLIANGAFDNPIDVEERRLAQSQYLPEGTNLAISASVHPAVLKAGKLFVKEVLQRSTSYPNMQFFGRVQLLQLLVSWFAFNCLARKAQTNILDKFYLVQVGLMHRSRKINYMENIIFYSLVKRTMPPVVAHVLYEKHHLVVNLNRNPRASDAHFHLDESQEALIIRDAKRLCINNEKVISSLVPWIMLLGIAHTTLSIAMGLSTVMKRSEDNLETEMMGTTVRAYDRERRTARNIHFMLRFCSAKLWLTEEHMCAAKITNVLADDPTVIEDDVEAMKLINADELGRFAAQLHLSCKMCHLFGDLSEEELKNYFNVSNLAAMRNHFTFSFQFKSMAAILNLRSPTKRERPKKE